MQSNEMISHNKRRYIKVFTTLCNALKCISGVEGSRTPVQTARYMNLYAYSVVI